MADYKTDQDRFFDNLHDIEDFRAATNARLASEAKACVDKLVSTGMAGRLFQNETVGRQQIIGALKAVGKLPPTYIYPDEHTDVITMSASHRPK
jgi:hypothetical protein